MSSRPPAVSVVLPTYNREAVVGRAIESVLNQTFRDLELIVVDDGSRDGTVDAVSRVEDPRLRLIQHETNRGGNAARNTGAEAASAPLLAFQDSDDFWLPRKLEAQLQSLGTDSEAGACYCGMITYGCDPNNRIGSRVCRYVPARAVPQPGGDLSRAVLDASFISTQTFLVETQVFRAAGGFDNGLAALQDWDLVIRVAQRAKIAFLEEPLVLAYVSEDSVSSQGVKKAMARIAVVEKHQELFRAAPAAAARHLYGSGRALASSGQRRDAIHAFVASLRWQPTQIRAGASLLLALTGSRR
jgi:glycosyltransferase involved in cell wall biosynthesis